MKVYYMQLIKYLLISTLAISALFMSNVAFAEEVNVYSYRQPFLVQPLFDKFTEATDIKVNVIFANQGLSERLEREGRNSPADLIFTVDIGRLFEVTDKKLTQSVSLDSLNQNIPSQYRDPQGQWFGLTTRTRSIFASKERVDLSTIKNYEDMSKPEWKGRICSRSGKHDYNLALIASMIANNGLENTTAWLKGVKANLAQKPQGNDRSQVKAIKEGVCDISLGNNYYFGNMLMDKDQKYWAESVFITFPNQDNRGTHVNISGMAMAKYAPNKASAEKLMTFLSEKTAQEMYAEQNFEYPVNPSVKPSELVQSWGTFKSDTLPLAEVAKLRKQAAQLVDEVAFDD
jgi:iron(III) transport system substrate-binding protein